MNSDNPYSPPKADQRLLTVEHITTNESRDLRYAVVFLLLCVTASAIYVSVDLLLLNGSLGFFGLAAITLLFGTTSALLYGRLLLASACEFSGILVGHYVAVAIRGWNVGDVRGVLVVALITSIIVFVVAASTRFVRSKQKIRSNA